MIIHGFLLLTLLNLMQGNGIIFTTHFIASDTAHRCYQSCGEVSCVPLSIAVFPHSEAIKHVPHLSVELYIVPSRLYMLLCDCIS